MKLSEELAWRGFVNQSTFKELAVLDKQPVKFYWGVDPSADSMTIGNLAAAMLVKCFIKHGHTPVLLIGGATGLVGDPDGKASERQLISRSEITKNRKAIARQYKQLFGGRKIKLVDNYDWFKNINYLDFLRDIGKHVPTRQMLAREFVQTRLSEDGAGISYAEFSYALIQAYDFLKLYQDLGVTLQLCGSDQWGNCIAGVDLIRRKTGGEAHVFSAPLITNKATGVKFGKTEEGAIWLDETKTTPTQFYQFWINVDDDSVSEYLKIFTELGKPEIAEIMTKHLKDPSLRHAQETLAWEVTNLVHGRNAVKDAEATTQYLTGRRLIGEAKRVDIQNLRSEINAVKTRAVGSIIEALVDSKLAASNSDARRLLKSSAISVNGQKVNREQFEPKDFQNGRLLLRRGKAFKDSALVELK